MEEIPMAPLDVLIDTTSDTHSSTGFGARPQADLRQSRNVERDVLVFPGRSKGRVLREEQLSGDELDVTYVPETGALWQFMKPQTRPSFTLGLLGDLRWSLEWARRNAENVARPIRYVVLASRVPGIFNLGGDLPHFVDLIRRDDHAGLRRYAYACIDVQACRALEFGQSTMNIALVQGDALGGGFEAALAADVIVAEKSAKFGLPEVLFSLFPGMGALSFLSRRLDRARAEAFVLSGKIYTAEEMRDFGVVDVLCEDGEGEEAVAEFMSANARLFHARRAIQRSRQLMNPVTKEELIRITDLWVDCALTLSQQDLRKMERLAAAQDRRWNSTYRQTPARAERRA
jgi:DSF synthase